MDYRRISFTSDAVCIVKSLPGRAGIVHVKQLEIGFVGHAEFRGVARNLLRGTNQGVWVTEVPSGFQGQNMETLENTNGAVTKTDLR